MSDYRPVNGVLMPFEGPPEASPSWVPGVTDEMEAAAEALFKADRSGSLMVTFAFQPAHVRLKFLKMVGYQA